MSRSVPLPMVLLTLVLSACATSHPAPPPVDPTTQPTIIGAVDEAAIAAAAAAAEVPRSVRVAARTAGVLAAIFGGPPSETIDDTVDRYRGTRDLVEATATVINVSKAATEGARRGLDLDQEFAEMLQIKGIDATRPYPDQIDVRFTAQPTQELLTQIVDVLRQHQERSIEIEGPGDAPYDVQDALVSLGLGETSLSVTNSRASDLVMHVHYLS